MALPVQAGCQGEVERLSGQLQEAIVAAEVGRAKVLLYEELNSKAEKLVSRPGRQAGPLKHTLHGPWLVHVGMRRALNRRVKTEHKGGCGRCVCSKARGPLQHRNTCVIRQAAQAAHCLHTSMVYG